jgi:2-hydroxychromene-2-carboxylate isomerase
MIQREAEAADVFGVPSYVLDDGDLYWGREHLAAHPQTADRRVVMSDQFRLVRN